MFESNVGDDYEDHCRSAEYARSQTSSDEQVEVCARVSIRADSLARPRRTIVVWMEICQRQFKSRKREVVVPKPAIIGLIPTKPH